MIPQHLDFLNAISYALPELRHKALTVARDTEILEGDPTSPWIGKWETVKPKGFGVPSTLRLHINIRPELPAIERMEMNLNLVTMAHWKLETGTYGDESEIRHALCARLGTWPGMLNQPDVRWRLLGAVNQLELLPYGSLEDRPKCVICPGRVATGAGAYVDEIAGVPLSGARAYRADVHHECLRYAHRVLAPEVRRARERREASAD